MVKLIVDGHSPEVVGHIGGVVFGNDDRDLALACFVIDVFDRLDAPGEDECFD